MGEMMGYVKDFGLLGIVAWVVYALINNIMPEMKAMRSDHAAMQEQHAKQNQILDEIVRRQNGVK